MNAQVRRQEILKTLKTSNQAITASQLAQQFEVSRQVIVGDIALLRAADHEIIATNQGYLLPSGHILPPSGHFVGKIVCLHTPHQTQEELEIIVQHGGKVQDVQVDHPIYGILSASLNIVSLSDIKQFMQQMDEYHGELLSSLTNGIHIHTIETVDKAHFDKICHCLRLKGILYE